MKLLRILGGIVTLFAGLFMVYGFFHIIETGQEVNPAIVHSVADKIFLFFLLAGCGGAYMVISMHLFSRVKISFPNNWSRPAIVSFVISVYAMLAGMIYHVIFLSPW